MPPVRKYFEVRQKSARWRMPKMDPNACLKGALIFTKKKEGLQLTGTLKRTWGIIMRESGEMHFEVLIPGGERIFWGYKKEIFVAPADGSESSVIIRLCSIPACYFPKYDDSALICEKELCVRSDKSMFPARKLQISIQVADTLFIELHDLITGNKESAMLEVEWEHGPDLLI